MIELEIDELLNQIEERLRARAGNPNISSAHSKKVEAGATKSTGSLGTGITAKEIDEIIKEFNS